MTDETNDSSHQLDESGFRELFSATYAQVMAYARRRSFDHSDADDIVSEVYASAWRRRDFLEPGTASLPWLYGIASNIMLNRWRANGRRLALVERLEAQPPPSPSSTLGADPAESGNDDLHAAMAKMSFDDQELLRLIAWEGLTHEEVAQVLDCSTNAVGIRVHRAKKRLKYELQYLETETVGQRPNKDDRVQGAQHDEH